MELLTVTERQYSSVNWWRPVPERLQASLTGLILPIPKSYSKKLALARRELAIGSMGV